MHILKMHRCSVLSHYRLTCIDTQKWLFDVAWKHTSFQVKKINQMQRSSKNSSFHTSTLICVLLNVLSKKLRNLLLCAKKIIEFQEVFYYNKDEKFWNVQDCASVWRFVPLQTEESVSVSWRVCVCVHRIKLKAESQRVRLCCERINHSEAITLLYSPAHCIRTHNTDFCRSTGCVCVCAREAEIHKRVLQGHLEVEWPQCCYI